MFHTRHPSARLFLVICALGVGCDNLEMDKRGSWEHYSAGGMLQIGTPTMTESGELFFVCGATGHGDIYAVDTANSSLRRITYSDDFEGSPVVVPDGSFLFFSRERDGKAVVYSLDLRSNTEVRITDGNAMEAPVAVLQNASFLLITTKQSSFGGHGEILSYGLASLGTPSTTVRRIGEFAVADSSGSHLIVLKEDGIWSLSGRAFENASKISIPFDAIPLAVSSDGGHVVVTKQAPAGEWKFDSELYLVEIESATITKIGNGHSPIVDREGSVVVFCSGYDNLLRQYVTATETISPIDFQASFKSNLALVDRGASIVFASVNDNRAENYEIYKLPLDSVRPFELFSVNSRAIEKEFSH